MISRLQREKVEVFLPYISLSFIISLFRQFVEGIFKNQKDDGEGHPFPCDKPVALLKEKRWTRS